MKKKYERPTMDVIEFQLNEAICACGAQLFDHSTKDACFTKLTTEGELLRDKMHINFAEDCSIPLDNYCYFTSANNTIFSS